MAERASLAPGDGDSRSQTLRTSSVTQARPPPLQGCEPILDVGAADAKGVSHAQAQHEFGDQIGGVHGPRTAFRTCTGVSLYSGVCAMRSTTVEVTRLVPVSGK